MPFMGDSRRRQLKRLSTRSTTTSGKIDGGNSDSTPITPRSNKSSKPGTLKQTPSKVVPVSPRNVSQTPRKNEVNVFAFMEEDEQGIDIPFKEHAHDIPDLTSSPGSTSSSSSPGPDLQSSYSNLEVHAGHTDTGYQWDDNPHKRGFSMHSDSGISMLSSSPEQESPVLNHRSHFITVDKSTPTVIQHEEGRGSSNATSAQELSVPQVVKVTPQDIRYVEEPEAYYATSPAAASQTPRTATFDPPHGLQATFPPSPYVSSPASVNIQRSPVPEVKKSGYDLLASSIGCRNDRLLTPIYRKFETLNNRILLYLQDEISEMEENLKELDAAIAQEEGNRTASRRSDPMYPSQLKWHRQDLMCRIFSKVEQYNLALSSYSNLATSLQPASHADIDAYRTWIVEHAPLVEEETDFVHNESDLMTLSRSDGQNFTQPDPTPIITVAVVLISTMIVFKVVPQLLARLVISAVVGLGGLCTLAPTIREDMTKLREWKTPVGIYAAVMLVLALVVG